MTNSRILGEVVKELAKEWHPSKNGSLTPFDVTTGSGKNVWWKCLHGHEWQAVVYSRVNGRGCSECIKTGNRSKKLAYKRSLAYKNPTLAVEWAFEKNTSLTPSDVGENSHKIVWWKCEKGHEWEATVSARTRSFKLGLGCPYCEKRILSKEYSLAVINPKLSTQWHPTFNNELKPNDITPNSHKIVWWKCEKGHEWKATIANRSRNNGCPYCSNRKIDIHNENSLAKQNPTLASEWHPTKNGNLTAENVPEYSAKLVWWQCKKGHEWKAKIANRSNKNGCPYCTGKKVCYDNCLEVVCPSLAKEWHHLKNGSLTPSMITSGSNKKVWWRCLYGHEWEAQINSRSRGNGCPKCNFSNSYPEQFVFYCLSYLYIDILQRYKIGNEIEVDIFIPSRQIAIEYDGSYWHRKSKKIKLDLKKNQYLYDKKIRLIRVRENGLDFLEDNETINLRINENPTDLELIDIVRSIIAIIDCGNINNFNEIISNDENLMLIKNNSRDFMLSKNPTNSLVAQFPYLIKEWNYQKNGQLQPENLLPQSNFKVWWKCKYGHEWQTTPSQRTRNGGGTNCPYCYGRYATEQISLAKVYPIIAEEWHPTKNGTITPFDVRPKSDKVVWWKCKQSHEWKEQVKQRTSRKGCPYCTGRFVTEQNCLANINLEIVHEWHPSKNGDLAPHQIKAQSNKKVWWLCNEGHSYETSPNLRYRGNGCPYCAGKKVDTTNSLASLKPLLATEWHPTKNGELTPELVTCGSSKKVWWVCEKGHEWMAVVKSRNRGSGCPECYRITRKK